MRAEEPSARGDAPAADATTGTDWRPDLGRLLLRAHRDFGERAMAKLRARGVSDLGLAHTALLATVDPQGTSITALAERTGMTKQAMSELALDLERSGYIVRAADPADRRVTTVRITDEGRRALGVAMAAKGEVESEYAAILGRRRLALLQETLAMLTDPPG